MKLYIVTRRDMPPGLMLAQAVHAGRAFPTTTDQVDNLACLEVATEAELLALVQKAVCLDVPYAVFREPDLGGTITSVAFAEGAKRILSSLPLALKAA